MVGGRNLNNNPQQSLRQVNNSPSNSEQPDECVSQLTPHVRRHPTDTRPYIIKPFFTLHHLFQWFALCKGYHSFFGTPFVFFLHCTIFSGLHCVRGTILFLAHLLFFYTAPFLVVCIGKGYHSFLAYLFVLYCTISFSGLHCVITQKKQVFKNKHKNASRVSKMFFKYI